MGLLDNYTGIGMSPRPKFLHQDYMLHTAYAMYEEVFSNGMIVRTEATVTDDLDDKAPDVIIYTRNNFPLMFLEITTHRERSRIMRKCEKLQARFPECECFVFDYETHDLFLLDVEQRCWHSNNDADLYSAYLQYPLMHYIEFDDDFKL